MRVLYDHQIFEMQRFGGISRYFFELMRFFSGNNLLQWECSVRFTDNEYIKELDSLTNTLLPLPEIKQPYSAFLKGKPFRGRHLMYKALLKVAPAKPTTDARAENRRLTIERINSKPFDIIHPTYYDEYILDIIGDKLLVITVYDMIHQIFPEYFPIATVDKSRRVLERANNIIAISHNTKKDIVSILGIPEEKVTVTHLASFLNTNNTKVESSFINTLPKNYFLFVGQRDIYKNFLFFVQMFATVAASQDDLYLVCTGSPFNKTEIAFLKNLNISDSVIQIYANDALLTYLYKHAVAFVFPSLYEGFGLPVLEAFSNGCPVVVSNTSSLKEISSDAAIYFEPKNPASLLTALHEALHNHALKTKIIQNGYQRLKDFSWSKTAIETKKVYEAALNNH